MTRMVEQSHATQTLVRKVPRTGTRESHSHPRWFGTKRLIPSEEERVHSRRPTAHNPFRAGGTSTDRPPREARSTRSHSENDRSGKCSAWLVWRKNHDQYANA